MKHHQRQHVCITQLIREWEGRELDRYLETLEEPGEIDEPDYSAIDEDHLPEWARWMRA